MLTKLDPAVRQLDAANSPANDGPDLIEPLTE